MHLMPLPPEIIHSVIECAVSPKEAQCIALPASHPTVKTLLSLTQVSSVTYPIAFKFLYSHGLYIDSAERLRLLVNSITSSEGRSSRKNEKFTLQSGSTAYISSLYLSYPAVNDFGIAQLVSTLFSRTSPYLRHLVIDMPLREYDADRSGEACATLRHAFSQLTALESFCSVRDECFLPELDPNHFTTQLSVWYQWPNLKTLILYNQDVTIGDFWQEIGKLKQLNTLVLTNPDGFDMLENQLVLHVWKSFLNKRVIKILCPEIDPKWKSFKEGGLSITFPFVPTSYYGHEDLTLLRQQWVKTHALSGLHPLLWD